MIKKFKLAGLLAALGFMALASGTASAGPIDFAFTNTGSIVGAVGCGSNCLRVTTSGTATSGTDSWAFNGIMQFSATSFLSFSGDGDGAGLGWSFTDTSGSDSLWGTFTGTQIGALGLKSWGTMAYIITGGSGLFGGATGSGGSFISFDLLEFDEHGAMHVNTVPEPGVTALLLAGFGMVAFMAFRRRRAQSQI